MEVVSVVGAAGGVYTVKAVRGGSGRAGNEAYELPNHSGTVVVLHRPSGDERIVGIVRQRQQSRFGELEMAVRPVCDAHAGCEDAPCRRDLRKLRQVRLPRPPRAARSPRAASFSLLAASRRPSPSPWPCTNPSRHPSPQNANRTRRTTGASRRLVT